MRHVDTTAVVIAHDVRGHVQWQHPSGEEPPSVTAWWFTPLGWSVAGSWVEENELQSAQEDGGGGDRAVYELLSIGTP